MKTNYNSNVIGEGRRISDSALEGGHMSGVPSSVWLGVLFFRTINCAEKGINTLVEFFFGGRENIHLFQYGVLCCSLIFSPCLINGAETQKQEGTFIRQNQAINLSEAFSINVGEGFLGSGGNGNSAITLHGYKFIPESFPANSLSGNSIDIKGSPQSDKRTEKAGTQCECELVHEEGWKLMLFLWGGIILGILTVIIVDQLLFGEFGRFLFRPTKIK